VDLPVVEDMNVWTLYLEDFSTDSPEWEHLFKRGTLTEIDIYYEKL
jgi:hypothetical protein